MELTEEQIKFLDVGCTNLYKLHSMNEEILSTWKVDNFKDEVDVNGSVAIQGMNLTELPVRFGVVEGIFNCSDNQLTTLKNCPTSVGEVFSFNNNPLTEYFKSIKEEDFPHWDKLLWDDVLSEYPFLVNIGKKYLGKGSLRFILNKHPLTKLYLE
jgi:hypothetical protein